MGPSSVCTSSAVSVSTLQAAVERLRSQDLGRPARKSLLGALQSRSVGTNLEATGVMRVHLQWVAWHGPLLPQHATACVPNSQVCVPSPTCTVTCIHTKWDQYTKKSRPLG